MNLPLASLQGAFFTGGHLMNLPLASLQATLAGGHLMNLPLASLHGAASAGLAPAAIRAIAAMAAANLCMTVLLHNSRRVSLHRKSAVATGKAQAAIYACQRSMISTIRPARPSDPR